MKPSVLRSPLSVLTFASRVIAVGVLALFFCSRLCAQALPPQGRYATHDWTRPFQNPVTGQYAIDFREAFADVKSAGDGRTYSVGTIEVKNTGVGAQALFSDSPCDPSTGLLPFDNLSSGRQIVVLQATDSTNLFPPNPTHPILWQRYFYGDLGSGALTPTTSNARGISVWPGATHADTRIAICGESYDQVLPKSQAPTPGWNNVTQLGGGAFFHHAGGFIAVYNGNGDLLWSHHFFTNRGLGGVMAYYGHCAITDVSIRTDTAGNDVVTYCGISSFGNEPGMVDSLTPTRPFAAPVSGATCQLPTGGDANNGGDQWDGIVGRLRRPHDPTLGSTTTVFHSIVGGDEQDGLFGIAEIDENVFVAVGSSGIPGTTLPTRTFPFTSLGTCPVVGNALGVAMVFNAGNIGPTTGNLELRGGQHLGLQQTNSFTVARDVFVVPRWRQIGSQVLIVGSTNEANLLSSLPVLFPGPQYAIGGQSDGFILAGIPFPPFGLTFFSGTYRGGPGHDGLTGIQGWNEFLDHFVVVGSSSPVGPPPLNVDIEAESYFIDTSNPSSPFYLRNLTATKFGGTRVDLPAAMGSSRATSGSAIAVIGSLPFDEYTLGDPAGGGIAVDQMARVNVVGTTESVDYPVAGSPPGRLRTVWVPPLPPPLVPFNDAVRAVLDMLPVGVRRTDGTGDQAVGTIPSYPLSGFFGGTTPECALTPFGRRVGQPDPALPRMLITGEPGTVTGDLVSVLVIRPPNNALLFSAWHLDFPGSVPGGGAPIALPEGVLLWTTINPVVVPQPWPPETTLQFPVGPLPGSPGIVSIQLICALSVPVLGGALGPVCSSPQSFLAASPALWFHF